MRTDRARRRLTRVAPLAILASAATIARAEPSPPVAADGPLCAPRFTVAVPVEVTLVGLTAGVRPEVLYRFGADGARSRVRLAVGLLDGPDQFFLPISLGYRAIFRQRARVQPAVGVGLELQHRLVSDFHAVRQYGGYVEGGLEVAIDGRWSIGLMMAIDVMIYGGPGIGLGPRLFVAARL